MTSLLRQGRSSKILGPNSTSDDNINKSKSAPDICQCCLSTKDLRSISKPYLYYGKNEIYSLMLSACFTEMIISDGLICSDCVRRLRATLNFKQTVESARKYLISNHNNLSSQKTDPIDITLEKSKEDDDDSTLNNEDNFIDFQQNDTSADNSKSDTQNIKQQDSESESSEPEDDLTDFFNSAVEAPQQVYSREEFDVGEQRTLPYVLDNTDRKCEICNKEFSFFGELLKHMPEHYPNHICDVCGKICATRKSLIFHTKTHTNVRLDCKLCEKSFKNKSNLNAHVKVQHKGEKILFKCSLCGEKLNTYNARIKHMAEKHGREDKAYKCLQCSCKYRLGSHLRAHVRRVHLQEKNYKCQVCGSSFFSRKCLENHSLKHSGERNFSCSVCHKSYGRKETLRQHVKSHEDDKSYMNAEFSQHCQGYI